MAREAINAWLRRQLRKARHNAISAYAKEMAGAALDIDPALESSGVEHLLDAAKGIA